MIDGLRYIPEDEPIDGEGWMGEDRDEKFFVLFRIIAIHGVKEFEYMDDEYNRLIFEYGLIFREDYFYTFLEESLGIEFEGFILLRDESNTFWCDSISDLRCDIFDNPRLLLELVLESSLSDGSTSCSNCFEMFHDSFEDISYIVRF